MQVPWEDLCYLFGEIMYGGHITDGWDRRLCKTYLQEFMHPKMVSQCSCCHVRRIVFSFFEFGFNKTIAIEVHFNCLFVKCQYLKNHYLLSWIYTQHLATFSFTVPNSKERLQSCFEFLFLVLLR